MGLTTLISLIRQENGNRYRKGVRRKTERKIKIEKRNIKDIKGTEKLIRKEKDKAGRKKENRETER